MSADYTVNLTVGPLSWTINRGDPTTFPASPEVLDGLRASWSMPDTDLWPIQPDPTALTFSLLAASADELAGIDINSPVTLLIYAGVLDATDTPVPSLRFVGRVSDLSGHPVKTGLGDAWQLDVIAVDLVAALADENVASPIGPGDTGGPYGWVYIYFVIAGIAPPDWGTGGNGCELTTYADGEIPSEALNAAVERTLAAYADGGPISGPEADPNSHLLYPALGWRRGIVVPNIGYDNIPDPDVPYAIEWVARRSLTSILSPIDAAKFTYSSELLTLVGPEKGWYVQITPPPATTWDPFFSEVADVTDLSCVISADYLDYGAVWARSKALDPNRVIVTTDQTGLGWRKVTRNTPSPAPADAPTVTAQLQSVRIADIDNARAVGDMYADGAYDNPNNRYQAQAFTWYASRDPQWPVQRGFFPDNSMTSLWRGFSCPVTLLDLPPGQSPNGARWHTGTLKGADWTFDRGEFSIGFTLYPRIPRQGRAFLDSFDWAGLTNPGLTPEPAWSNLYPGDNWIDYRLLRPTATDYPTGP